MWFVDKKGYPIESPKISMPNDKFDLIANLLSIAKELDNNSKIEERNIVLDAVQLLINKTKESCPF